MIAFLLRFIALFFILGFLCIGFLFFGEPNEEDFIQLFMDLSMENVPTLLFMMSLIATFAFFISLWMGVNEKRRELTILRYVKQLPDASLDEKKKNVSRSLERALIETNALIDTQRKSLQRLTNEKVEANDKEIQERIIAERQRLARELHDSVSQQLFAASMMLSALTEQEGNENRKALKQIEKIVQQAQLEMRALLLHLRPIALRDNTLAEGLRELISELQQKVYFQIDVQIEDIELSKAEEDHLFRIAQEALSNTLRHSKAKEVELLLIARDDMAIFRIQDNGIGFNMEEDKSTSYGLKNIAERAVEIGCKYKIVSVPGEGTIVEVKVPLKKKGDGEVTE